MNAAKEEHSEERVRAMRVIAGDFKGRNLKAPMGMDTRPTTDRVKESFISSLISAYGPPEGAHVLDAFAGSGAIGIECP